MKTLPTENEIISKWKKTESPIISIICTTFNHGEYVHKAIESFLTQKTIYNFEIIIHDDASTDNTTLILNEYKEKYPTIIRLLLQDKNKYIDGKRAIILAQKMARGKYIAICEGDDYWCDNKKLQIQIEFLEKNKDYFISCHNAFYVEDKKEVKDKLKLSVKYQKDFSKEELTKGEGFLLTLSWVFRNEIDLNNIPESLNVVNLDYFLTSIFGLYGKSKYHAEIKPAAYRIHNGGVWSLVNSQERRAQNIYTNFSLYQYHRHNKTGYEKFFLSRLLILVIYDIYKSNSSLYFVKNIINRMKNKIKELIIKL